MRADDPSYRELYLKYYRLYAREEGRFQRLLFMTRELAKRIPKRDVGWKRWKEYEKQIEESECNESY